MGKDPAKIIKKLGFLETEAKEYLGKDFETCFGIIGDMNFDNYPLQFRPFGKGPILIEELSQLVIEGGGGGDIKESYQLAGLFCLRNMETPNATTKPVLILIGDEAPHDFTSKEMAKKFNIDIEAGISTEDIFKELKEKFSVYMIRRKYNDSGYEKQIQKRWEELLDKQRIANLSDAGRIVDVIFGLLAAETDKVDYFKKEIEDRQTKEQVDTVYKSLKTVHLHLEEKNDDSGKSKMFVPADAKKTKHLLGKKKDV